MTPGFDRNEYARLVAVFAPIKIGDNAQAEATEMRIEELLTRPEQSEAERVYLDLLSDLLADWEDRHVDIPDIHGSELIRVLLKERGLRQRDLVGIFSTESVVSEVLTGHRELSRDHIAGLAGFFHVSPAVFFPAQTDHQAGTHVGPNTAPSPIGRREQPSRW